LFDAPLSLIHVGGPEVAAQVLPETFASKRPTQGVAGAPQALVNYAVEARAAAFNDQPFAFVPDNQDAAAFVFTATGPVLVRQTDFYTADRRGKPPKGKVHAPADIVRRGRIAMQFSGNDLNTHFTSPLRWHNYFLSDRGGHSGRNTLILGLLRSIDK
jgi:hypothetical protein